MKNVIFEPWVGDNYVNGFNGKKILALGDSQYGDVENSAHKLVEHFIGYKNGNIVHMAWMNTYAKFSNVLLGEKADGKTTIDFWNSIVFYNYVQKSQTGHSITPLDEDYDNSHNAFIEILEEYQPDLIIVWGWSLWGRTAKYGMEADFTILEDKKEKFYYFEINGKKIPACGIPHPRVLSKDWTPYLQEAIKLA